MFARDRFHCDSSILRALFIGSAVLSSLGIAGDVSASPIPWALFDPACARGTSTLEVPCGSYGVFHFLHVVPPAGCQPIVAGIEDPPLYAPPGHLRHFPHGVPDNPVNIPAGLGIGAGSAAGFRSTVSPSTAPVRADGSAMPVPSLPAPEPRITVIDFSGVHGNTTSWLVDEIAGASVNTTLSVLDDPALSGLGSVGDFHFLAKLCEIAESIDVLGMDPPRAVNMSFGRSVTSTDGDGVLNCSGTVASCQIARVIGRLHARGIDFVAAAGNHQETLFPGSLASVLEVGMLELNAFFESGAVDPAWETPEASRALVPGNGLCLGQWAAPAGSSYASAMFTGWLSDILARRPSLDPLVGSVWAPEWSHTLGCYVLAQGSQTYPWCNAKITALFQGLEGANEATCWGLERTSIENLPQPGAPEPQPAMPSYAAWATATSPAPESDPCVPCVGKVTFGSSDLELNVSQAAPMPEGLFIHGVYLRVGDDFLSLSLSQEQIDALASGALGTLLLHDAAALVAPGEQPSLWYEMKDEPSTDCAQSTECFWSSTPIFLKEE